MCEFCNPETYREFYIMENDAPYVNMKLENFGGEVAIVGIGDNFAVYHPKYCPECGRRLVFDDGM